MGSVLILALKGCGHLNIRLFLLLIPLLVHVSFVSANSELYQSLSGDESTVNHECVVLLHGLARGSGSMVLIEERLLAEGYGAMFFLSVGNSLNLRDPSSIMLEISDETARFQHPHLSI